MECASSPSKMRRNFSRGITTRLPSFTDGIDPFSMLALALPLTVLLMVTEQIARAVERRRARADEAAAPG